MRLPAYQELSKEQDIVCNLPLNQSHLVIGPPGTGKTVLALHRAKMLKDRGHNCVLIMHSKLLRTYVGTALTKLDLQANAMTFHSWFGKLFWDRYHYKVPELERYRFDWQKIMSQVNEDPLPRTDLDLLIDEGQDLSSFFYILASHLARTVTIYADENQAITDSQSTIRQIQSATRLINNTYCLTRNYRNTYEIAQLASSFYAGLQTGMPELPERHGTKPEMRRTRTFQEFIDRLARFERTNSDLDIGVFTYTLAMQDRIRNALEQQPVGQRLRNPVQSYSSKNSNLDIDFGRRGIRLVTFQSAKGLEFDAVFIPELQDVSLSPTDPITKTWFYVLTSRARQQLYLSYSTPESFPLLDMFRDAQRRNLLEWHI